MGSYIFRGGGDPPKKTIEFEDLEKCNLHFPRSTPPPKNVNYISGRPPPFLMIKGVVMLDWINWSMNAPCYVHIFCKPNTVTHYGEWPGVEVAPSHQTNLEAWDWLITADFESQRRPWKEFPHSEIHSYSRDSWAKNTQNERPPWIGQTTCCEAIPKWT